MNQKPKCGNINSNVYWESISLQSLNGTHIYNPLIKILKNVQFFILIQKVPTSLCYVLILKESNSDQKWSIAAKSGLELPNLHFLALSVFKINYIALWLINYFPFYYPFLTDKTLQANHNCITKKNTQYYWC